MQMQDNCAPIRSRLSVTVVIIAKNEEDRIEDCLKSVAGWAAEIIVLDDESTDLTAVICEKYGAKVIRRRMESEGFQRNFGISLASQPWILSLDADERVTTELAEEICETLRKNEPHVCYAMPVRNYLGNLWLHGAGYYPAAKARLYKKGFFSYDEAARVHPRVFYGGSCGRLKGELIHLSFRNIEHLLQKFNRETSLEAEKWITERRRVAVITILRKSIDRFLKNYLLKGGWKMGFYGLLMSLFHGLYQMITYAKFREIKQNGAAAGSVGTKKEISSSLMPNSHIEPTPLTEQIKKF